MISVKFNYKKGILESYFEGNVTLKEIVDYIIAIKENVSYPRALKILTDTTKANLDFIPDDLPIIVEENNKSLEKYEFITDAIVLDNPDNTALSVLYKELTLSNKYRFKLFSTREEATMWLDNN